jgi:hypothetical protein
VHLQEAVEGVLGETQLVCLARKLANLYDDMADIPLIEVVDTWSPPENHPISIQEAKRLLAGDLGAVYRSILATSCAPLYWYRTDRGDLSILHNGTVTFLRTPQRLLGVTAAHVLNAYLTDAAAGGVRAQIMDGLVDDLQDRIICISRNLDIATFEVDEKLLNRLGKRVVPLAEWPPRPPQEGRGIMLTGYPAIERRLERNEVDFGLFTALAIARTVTDVQITWLVERDEQFQVAGVEPPPLRYGLGGVSGGPLIGFFESPAGILTYALSGIITEHPNYEQEGLGLELVVAERADFIQANGRIAR